MLRRKARAWAVTTAPIGGVRALYAREKREHAVRTGESHFPRRFKLHTNIVPVRRN